MERVEEPQREEVELNGADEEKGEDLDKRVKSKKDLISQLKSKLGGGGGAHPLFAAFCRRRVGRFGAMIAAKSGKFYTIFSGILSLNRQVLPNIL